MNRPRSCGEPRPSILRAICTRYYQEYYCVERATVKHIDCNERLWHSTYTNTINQYQIMSSTKGISVSRNSFASYLSMRRMRQKCQKVFMKRP